MTILSKGILPGGNQRRFEFLCRFILGVVFVWAGVSKIADPQKFAITIANYQLLPEYLVNSVAIWLPWVEISCGVLLICGIWIDGSLLVVNTLLVIFMAALILNWIRGIDVDCGCFSVAASKGESNTFMDIVRDAVLLGIGLTVFYSRARLYRS